jgi:hypothetical protein
MITPIVTDAITIGSFKNPGQLNLIGDGTVSNVLNINTLSINGKVGINSANGVINYGNSGQVLTSTGANSVPNWANAATTYQLPVASASTLGGIKVGSGLSMNVETSVLSSTSVGGVTLAAVIINAMVYG